MGIAVHIKRRLKCAVRNELDVNSASIMTQYGRGLDGSVNTIIVNRVLESNIEFAASGSLQMSA